MKIPLLAITTLALATTSQATLLYQQNFDTLNLGALNGQDGFTALSDAQVTTVTGGQQLTYTTPAPANNYAFVNSFAAQSGTVYFSFTMSWTAQQADDFLYFAVSNDADASPIALGNSAGVVINGFGAANGTIGLRMRNDSTGNTTQTSSGTVGGDTSASTYTFVASLSKVSSTNYNTLSLWINPPAGPEGVAALTITRDIGISSGLDTFFLFSGGSNEASEIIRLDNILIGTTYADVVSAVPEPSTYAAFAGAAVLGLVALRRRR